ncbi:histidinol-phosphate transaminase [Risungbinella massiliensis]|uniref:histidinol-phosphate transaminase n=1 Tax=Risungbinella massiliensis TaxID=1329796 RepID=UPI0005CB92F1|nr:histidinol-phosphate transaminase [Risungbinella massiliensis]
MQSKNSIQGLGVYQPGKPIEEVKREHGFEKTIKLASNENPFGSSRYVWEAIEKAKFDLALYPEGDAPLLKEKVAEQVEVDPRRLIFGNGSDEVIRLLTRAYLEAGEEAVMAEHTFPRYETNVRIDGGVPVKVPLLDGKHDLQGMLAAITEKTKLVFLCNPDNPTGTIFHEAELQAFLDEVPPQVLIILDEAYVEYVDDPDYPDSISLLDYNPQIVILRTFSKIYGLAALRVGYGIAHPDVIQELQKVRDPFNVGRLSQIAAIAAIEDQTFVNYCRIQNRMGLKVIKEKLTDLGLRYLEPHGNFILFDTGRPSEEGFQALLKQGIIVRPGNLLGFPNHLRVSVGTREENEEFLKVLTNWIQVSE